MGIQKSRRFLSRLVILGLLTLAYFAAGKFGLSLAFVNPSTTVVWAPTGIALAAFLILGDYAGVAFLQGLFSLISQPQVLSSSLSLSPSATRWKA